MKYLFALIITFSFFSCQPKAESDVIKIATVQEFSSQMTQPEVQLIDVRTPAEYQQGHVENAKNINVLDAENFNKEIALLDKNKPVMVYCKSGKRSNKAAQILEDAGFVDITDLKGGYQDLQ